MLETSLVVAVTQGRDSGSAAALLAQHAPDAKVVACDLFSGFKTAADTLEGATVVADVFHLVRLGLAALDEVRRTGALSLFYEWAVTVEVAEITRLATTIDT